MSTTVATPLAPMSESVINNIREDGVTMDTYATLINHFARTTDLPDHRQQMIHWFDEMKKIGTPTNSVYDVVIGCFAVERDTKNMLHYAQMMRKDGLKMDLIVFTHIIRHFSLMPDTPQMLFWWSEMAHNEVRHYRR